jgi:hypothetical protein
MFHTWAGAAVRERVKCALEDLNVKSESVLQSKGQTTMPVRGRENKSSSPRHARRGAAVLAPMCIDPV